MLVHHALLSNQISSPFLRAFTPPLTAFKDAGFRLKARRNDAQLEVEYKNNPRLSFYFNLSQISVHAI